MVCGFDYGGLVDGLDCAGDRIRQGEICIQPIGAQERRANHGAFAAEREDLHFRVSGDAVVFDHYRDGDARDPVASFPSPPRVAGGNLPGDRERINVCEWGVLGVSSDVTIPTNHSKNLPRSGNRIGDTPVASSASPVAHC